MSKTVEIKLWGTTIGFLGYKPSQTAIATFEYTSKLQNSPIEISPIKMPNKQSLHSFPDISLRTFKGIPGVFADSLPDKFGNQLIDIYMAHKGIPEDNITTIDRLLYIGDRAMGAVEYHPVESLNQDQASHIALDVDTLAELASMVLNKKGVLSEQLSSTNDYKKAIRFVRVGSSAGGARSKALIARDKEGKIYDGTINHGIDHTYWLMKFDSEDNADRDSKDPKGSTIVEYIYSLLAIECDIDMPRTDYIESKGDFHFLIERFDRVVNNNKLDKLHYASWCGLAHAHRDETGAYSYEQLILLARQLKLGQTEVTELFRRAVFNVIGKNQDDHTKNFGFLMNRRGEWSLAPAFDLTYSYDPEGQWTKTHQIKLNNKQDGFTKEDLLIFGKYCNLPKSKANAIIDKTLIAFNKFDELAVTYSVPKTLKQTVINNLRDLK